MIYYDMDNADDQQRMIKAAPMGVMPRQTKYGDADAAGIPYGEAYPDDLVDLKDAKEIIQHCHDEKIFPVYHQQATWAPTDFEWTQDGLGYCWTWSGTGNLMNCRAREGKETVMLAPVSMGWLVNWRNKGNYLESFIRGVQERGIAPASYVPDQHSPNPRKFKKGWEAAALNFRLPEKSVWDCDPGKMLQHCLSQLKLGVSLYSAWNRLFHAMSVVGLLWDETKYNNVVWQVRNSHNETEPIHMSGRNAEPDESFGFNSTLTC